MCVREVSYQLDVVYPSETMANAFESGLGSIFDGDSEMS